MGCSASRLEDEEEVVQLCKDRRNFIKNALEQRNRFASGHIAYINSLQQVSIALRNYVEGEEHHGFLLDSYATPPFTPVKKLNSSDVISVPIKSFEKSTVHVMKYMKSTANASSVRVEEWPRSPETVRADSYYPVENYGMDGFFGYQGSPMYHNYNSSSFFPSPYSRPSYRPPSPQPSQWDLFWNPFSSWDSNGYTLRNSVDRITSDDENAGLMRVREEEGIPELEEDDDVVDDDTRKRGFIEVDLKDERRTGIASKPVKIRTTEREEERENFPTAAEIKRETVQEKKEFVSQGTGSVGVSESRNAVDLEVSNEQQQGVAGNRGVPRDPATTPGFTVYVNRKPLSMTEVMNDIENQFMRICDCAQEISVLLEANRVQSSSSPTELAVRMLNPAALFRSASSRSTSSRFFLPPSSSSRDEFSESSSEYSDDSCMVSGSHQSTLDRLYVWEKKLYEEVKKGERIRIAYERKCMQLKSQDINGDEPSAVDKTRQVIRDLHTRLTVSIHTVESISRRIQALRDDELYVQLLELIQGLARMWRTMADCHAAQKRTLDDAKLLFLSTTLAAARAAAQFGGAHIKPSRSAVDLESALRCWRAALEAWVGAQRSYARALAGWARRCAGTRAAAADAAAASPLMSPRPSLDGGGATPPLYSICMQWAKAVEGTSEARVVDGLDFMAAGIASVSGSVVASSGEAAEVGPEAAERAAEVAARVMWTGMAATIGGLKEFAAASAEGYEEIGRGSRGEEGVAGS